MGEDRSLFYDEQLYRAEQVTKMLLFFPIFLFYEIYFVIILAHCVYYLLLSGFPICSLCVIFLPPCRALSLL